MRTLFYKIKLNLSLRWWIYSWVYFRRRHKILCRLGLHEWNILNGSVYCMNPYCKLNTI